VFAITSLVWYFLLSFTNFQVPLLFHPSTAPHSPHRPSLSVSGRIHIHERPRWRGWLRRRPAAEGRVYSSSTLSLPVAPSPDGGVPCGLSVNYLRAVGRGRLWSDGGVPCGLSVNYLRAVGRGRLWSDGGVPCGLSEKYMRVCGLPT
jgi:hypothetical protein